MDKINSKKRSENMRRICSCNTKPELVIRRILFGMGYRYRLFRKELPGKPDIVFFNRKKIIFVHGCFWHQHKSTSCSDSRIPKTNLEYWKPKLYKNVQRDKKNKKILKKLGWKIMIVWDCKTKDIIKIKKKLKKFLGEPQIR